MARIIQIIRADDESIITEEWHAVKAFPYNSTVCGLQLEGEDGVETSKEISGVVTCGTCYRIIEEIKSIRGWK